MPNIHIDKLIDVNYGVFIKLTKKWHTSYFLQIDDDYENIFTFASVFTLNNR